jgi:dinuclear metal center YbgI/SA1388 family protein
LTIVTIPTAERVVTSLNVIDHRLHGKIRSRLFQGEEATMAERDEIVQYCSVALNASEYQDIALNGLQVEGSPVVQHLTLAVSCNQQSIDSAIECGSDALLVHHGLVLDGRLGLIKGPVRRRLSGLLANDINLIAYHLPLDGHREIGNNARIMAELGLDPIEPLETFGPMPIGYIATSGQPRSLIDLIGQVFALTEREPVVLPGGPVDVSRVAVLSGSGYPALEEAAAKGCDVLLTGDIREPTMAMARELGITVIAAGHEATERLGVQALGARLQDQFGIDIEFSHDPNPV